MSNSTIVPIPFQGTELLTVEMGGKPYVILRPAFEALGLDADKHIERVSRQAWATTAVMGVIAQDGKIRQMIVADCRTFLGALMTITVSRVKPELRETLTAYQTESLDAIEIHWYGDRVKTTKKLQDARSRASSMMRELGALRNDLDIVREDARRLATEISHKDARIDALERRQAQGSIRDSIERYIRDEFISSVNVEILDHKPEEWESAPTWAKANLAGELNATRESALAMLVQDMLSERELSAVHVYTAGRRVDTVYPISILEEASNRLGFKRV